MFGREEFMDSNEFVNVWSGLASLCVVYFAIAAATSGFCARLRARRAAARDRTRLAAESIHDLAQTAATRLRESTLAVLDDDIETLLTASWSPETLRDFLIDIYQRAIETERVESGRVARSNFEFHDSGLDRIYDELDRRIEAHPDPRTV